MCHVRPCVPAAEELAELERQRLEALEAQRKRRMDGEEDDEDDGEGGEAGGDGGAAAPLPAGGYAARRAKRARADEWRQRRLGGESGDAMEDDFEAGSDSEGEEDSGELLGSSREPSGCGGGCITGYLTSGRDTSSLPDQLLNLQWGLQGTCTAAARAAVKGTRLLTAPSRLLQRVQAAARRTRAAGRRGRA